MDWYINENNNRFSEFIRREKDEDGLNILLGTVISMYLGVLFFL